MWPQNRNCFAWQENVSKPACKAKREGGGPSTDGVGKPALGALPGARSRGRTRSGGGREIGCGPKPDSGFRIPVPHPRSLAGSLNECCPAGPTETRATSSRHLQFLVEPSLAAGLEVADDDAELPDILHELLQVLLQVVELLRHGPMVSTATGVALLHRFLLPPGPTTTSVSSAGRRSGD